MISNDSIFYSKIRTFYFVPPPMNQLRTGDIIALGFMTFALFIGAGNIIFPPIVAQQAGEHVWLAAFGFLITAVESTCNDHHGLVTYAGLN